MNDTEFLGGLSENEESGGLSKLLEAFLPLRFGDYFEVFTFLAHLRWHVELLNLLRRLTPDERKEDTCPHQKVSSKTKFSLAQFFKPKRTRNGRKYY